MPPLITTPQSGLVAGGPRMPDATANATYTIDLLGRALALARYQPNPLNPRRPTVPQDPNATRTETGRTAQPRPGSEGKTPSDAAVRKGDAGAQKQKLIDSAPLNTNTYRSTAYGAAYAAAARVRRGAGSTNARLEGRY